LEDAFELFQIPFHVVSGRPLSDLSPIRGLIRLLTIAHGNEDYSRRSVIKFLASRPLKREIFGENSRKLSALFDLVSREAAIIKGREDWEKRPREYLEALKAGLESEKTRWRSEEEDEEKVQKRIEWIRKKIRATEKLSELSSDLIRALESLKKCRSFKALAEQTGKLAEKYINLETDEISGRPEEDESRMGLKAKLEEALSEMAELDSAKIPADFQTFCELLLKKLSASSVRIGKFRQGAVCLSELMAARGARFKAVVLPGLCESSFPLKLSESPLLADDDREEINREIKPAGFLAEKWRRLQEERLLFYLACDQAGGHLCLTCSWLDLGNNRDKTASYFLLNALSRFMGTEIDSDNEKVRKLAEENKSWMRWVELSDFAPAKKELALNPEEWEAMKIEAAQSAQEYRHLLKTPWMPRLAALASERWLGDDLGVFTGVPGTDAAYEIGDFSIISRKVSASSIKDYLGCPFVYFLKRILAVEEMEEPEKNWGFERLAQGNVVHIALEKLFKTVKNEKELKNTEAFKKSLRQILGQDGDQYLKTDYHSPENLRKLELDEIYAYLVRWHKYLLPEPGSQKWEAEKWIDSKVVSLELDKNQKVFLSGKIDRIDFAGDKACVCDYKVSKSIDSSPLNQVQLPIYLLSVRNMFGIAPEKVTAKFIIMVPEKLAVPEQRKITGKKMEQHLESLRKLVKAMVAGIEKGVFAPTASGCGYCDYGSACYAAASAYGRKKNNPMVREMAQLVKETSFKEENDESG